MTPPIIASAAPDGIAVDARIFDAEGRRLEADGDGGLRIASQTPGGPDELAAILRNWLGHMDALRESTGNWSLASLVRAAVDHLGYTA